jgi:hypothetical protein
VFDSPSRLSSIRLATFSLFGLSLCVFLGKSHETSLQALDSATHALLALEVTSKGAIPNLPMANFVTNHRPDLTFNDHPFTLFYLVGQLMRSLGSEAWVVRLLPGLFSAGAVLLTALLGRALYSPVVGLVAGLILLLSRDFVLIGSRFHLDSAMVFFILLSFLFWWKKRPVLAGMAAGLGLWMKAPVAYLLFPAALLAAGVSGTLHRQRLRQWFLAGGVAAGTGALIWILTGIWGGWDLVSDYWTRQVWGTAIGGRGAGGPTHYTLGIELLLRHYLPWVVFLPFALLHLLRRNHWKREEFALPLAAAIILEGVISSIRFKHYWYFVPVFPFLALILAGAFRKGIERHTTSILTGIQYLGLLIPVLLVCFPISLGPESFPALRKFHPFVQSYGSPADRVLFIDGRQPFGTALDSMYELALYTGRRILQAKDCTEAAQLLETHRPEWIVLTAKEARDCLLDTHLRAYPFHLRFADQHLLSRLLPPEAAGDLTPLHRELKAPRNGIPAPEPRDPYFPRVSRDTL